MRARDASARPYTGCAVREPLRSQHLQCSERAPFDCAALPGDSSLCSFSLRDSQCARACGRSDPWLLALDTVLSPHTGKVNRSGLLFVLPFFLYGHNEVTCLSLCVTFSVRAKMLLKNRRGHSYFHIRQPKLPLQSVFLQYTYVYY